MDEQEEKPSGASSSAAPAAAPAEDVPLEQVDGRELVKGLPDACELTISDEAKRAKARCIPVMPSLDERHEHRLAHLPYRSWCLFCVKGRGRETPHSRIKDVRRDVPVVMMDYCFVGFEKDPGNTATILVFAERESGAIESAHIEAKGPALFPVDLIVKTLQHWGWPE